MRYLKVAAALAVGAACAAPGAATAQDFTVGMPTTPPNIVHMATILANDLGFYKKYGIDVKFVALDGGVKVYRAMIAGSLDIALAPGAFTITGVAKGAAARIVYVNTPKNEASMVANANVKDMADLKGKRIGIQQPGGFADINSRAVLRAAKIDPKDVSFVSIATEDVPALVANQIDTGILHVEQEMLAKSKAPGIHAIARMWELQPKTLYLATVVSDKTIKEKADKLKAYIKANIEATRVMYTDKAKVLPTARQAYRLSGQDRRGCLRLHGQELHLGRQYRHRRRARRFHGRADDQGRQHREGQDAQVRCGRSCGNREGRIEGSRRVEGPGLPERTLLTR